MEKRLLLKILDGPTWDAMLSGADVEAPVDIADGYVHFSTADQVQETLDKWFQGVEGAVLIAFDARGFEDTLKWEVSRGGDLFPHVYGKVSVDKAVKHWKMSLGPNNAPIAPTEALNFEING